MKPDNPMFIFWWHMTTRCTYRYKEEAEWVGRLWHTTNHPPFRILRRQIIRTLVRNRIIT